MTAMTSPLPPTKFSFTDAKLKALPLPPEGQRVAYRDTKAAGLELRVSSTGARTFSWYRRTKGRAPERVTLGSLESTSLAEARKRANELNVDRDRGESPALKVRANKAELTFGELFARYMDEHAKLKKRTWKDDQQRYDQYLAKHLGKLLLKDVKRPHIAKLHARITADGHPAVANRVLALMSIVLNRAITWGYVDLNEASKIPKNRETARDRFIGAEELPRFMAALEAEPNGTAKDFFKLALFTGARRSNVLEMRWSDVDLTQGIWRIPRTKNGTPQYVVLIEEAVEILRLRRAASGGGEFVLSGDGSRGHLVEPKKAWTRLFDRDELDTLKAMIARAGGTYEAPPPKKRATKSSISDEIAKARATAEGLGLKTSAVRLKPARIHDLRRTNGSWQAMEGASLHVIGKSLNHKSVSTTATYARLQNDPVRNSVRAGVGAMLAAAAKSPELPPVAIQHPPKVA